MSNSPEEHAKILYFVKVSKILTKVNQSASIGFGLSTCYVAPVDVSLRLRLR